MANTLNISITASYQGQGLNATAQVSGYVAAVTTNQAPEGVLVQSVPTTAGGVVIPVGGISAPRYLYVQNLDPTNYVTIMTGVSGTAIARLLPGASGGDAMLIPLDPSITAPAWIAHTGACNVAYRVFGT